MKAFIIYLISFIISSSIFIFFSIKFSWNKKLWTILNKKINPNCSVVIWVLTTVLTQGIISGFLSEAIGFGILIREAVLGVTFGLFISFMPNLEKKRKLI